MEGLVLSCFSGSCHITPPKCLCRLARQLLRVFNEGSYGDLCPRAIPGWAVGWKGGRAGGRETVEFVGFCSAFREDTGCFRGWRDSPSHLLSPSA